MKLSPPSIPAEMKIVDSELVDAIKLAAPSVQAEINSVDSEVVALEGDDALKLSAPSVQDEINSVDSEIVSVEDNDALKLSAPSVPVADTELAAVDDEDDMPEEATMEEAIAAYEEEQVKKASFKNDKGKGKLEDTALVMEKEEVKKASFKNDKGKGKLEDTALVMEKEVIASESAEVVEDTVVIMEKDASTSEIVEVELCPICFGDVPEAEDGTFTVHGCFDKVCVACMTGYLHSYVLQQRKSLTCPMLGCKYELQIEDCNMIVGSDQMALVKQLKAEARIHVAHRVYCPNPRCSLLMSARELKTFDAALPGARQCLQCGSRFCINCKMLWHKKMTCSEFQKTKAYKKSETAVFDAVARGLGFKKCRKCQSTVERADGPCNHMTCTFCKYEFCYKCGNEGKKTKPPCKCATKVDK